MKSNSGRNAYHVLQGALDIHAANPDLFLHVTSRFSFEADED
jgi:hypothetical protein